MAYIRPEKLSEKDSAMISCTKSRFCRKFALHSVVFYVLSSDNLVYALF